MPRLTTNIILCDNLNRENSTSYLWAFLYAIIVLACFQVTGHQVEWAGQQQCSAFGGWNAFQIFLCLKFRMRMQDFISQEGKSYSKKNTGPEGLNAALTSKYFSKASLNLPWLWSSLPCDINNETVNDGRCQYTLHWKAGINSPHIHKWMLKNRKGKWHSLKHHYGGKIHLWHKYGYIWGCIWTVHENKIAPFSAALQMLKSIN